MNDYIEEPEIPLALALIRLHEGEKHESYFCTANKLTWGVGRNIQDVGLSVDEMAFILDSLVRAQHSNLAKTVSDLLLHNDVINSITDLEGFRFWDELDYMRRAALIDFRFNVGFKTFRKFKKLIGALEVKDYSKAARELTDSLWFKQVGNRSVHVRAMIRDGELPDDLGGLM